MASSEETPLDNDDAIAEQFRREAQTVASLHHESIVPICAVGEADGHSYFAMQWIDGESVSHQIAKRKGLEVARKAERLRLREIAGWRGPAEWLDDREMLPHCGRVG